MFAMPIAEAILTSRGALAALHSSQTFFEVLGMKRWLRSAS
jgi:hypothetical protein